MLNDQQLEFLKLLSQGKSKTEILVSLIEIAQKQKNELLDSTVIDYNVVNDVEAQCFKLLQVETKEELIDKYYEYLLEMEF